MDFTPSEAQRDLGALVRRVLADQVPLDGFDRALWTVLAKSGVLAAALPARAGGDGYGLLEQCTVLVEVGRAAAAVPYLSAIVAAASTVAHFGDDDQVARWAGPAGRGDLVLTAAPEAAVHASRTAGRWVLTGTATAVPALPHADLVLVPTQAAVLLVRPDDPGVSVQPQEMAGGEGAGRLVLAGTELADDRVLGGPDSAADIAGWLTARAVVGHCAAQLGVLERALELTVTHARTRIQFGRPIGSFQAVAQRLADGYLDVEAVRLTMWQAAWALGVAAPDPTALHTAKFWAAEAGHRVAHTAVHVHGGVGIDLAHPLHRYFLAAKYHEFSLGGATEHLLQLGALLAT